MPNTLNDIFAHLDNAKASRAYEANQERRRKVEEAEHERKVKQAAESAVEKYHVYDDDYDVEDVEEPLVMIPKQNPGTPEAKAATMPASKKDMDDIADNNPFVQNLFKHSHKQVKQERPAREKPAADKNAAKATQTLAAPAPEPTAPQNEMFNIPVVPVPAQPAAPSAPETVDTIDTVDFVDDIPLDIEFDDTEADVQNEQPDQSVQNEAVPAQSVASQNAEAVPVSNEPTAQPENVPAQEPTAFAAHLDASPDTKEEKPEKNSGYHEPVGEMVIPDKKPEQLETPAWPDGMNGPKFTESVVAYGSLPRKVGAEEANVFLFARYNTDKDMGSYGLCIDMGKDFVQSSKCGKANNPEEYALMGAIEMLLALDEHTVRDVVIYTEPVVAKIMNENANRLLDGKSPVRRKYIELAWKAMTKVSVRFVTTKVNSEYGKLALATAKYLAFCER
jgi:hypothetical protein